MFVYSADSAKKRLTDWGIEVKKKLLDMNMKQDSIVLRLNELGFKINKVELCNLLYGIGISVRHDEIMEINKMLNIPFEN